MTSVLRRMGRGGVGKCAEGWDEVMAPGNDRAGVPEQELRAVQYCVLVDDRLAVGEDARLGGLVSVEELDDPAPSPGADALVDVAVTERLRDVAAQACGDDVRDLRACVTPAPASHRELPPPAPRYRCRVT